MRRRVLLLLLATSYSLPLLTGCGFHLRGRAQTTLPEQYSVMRVRLINSQVSGQSLRVDMKSALTAAGVQVVSRDDDQVPSLNLYDERSNARVITVDENVRVSDFLLRYSVAFDVTDREGKELRKRQTIILQRVFAFDKFAVLAKEREAQEVRNQLRQEAVQQIIRRLAAR